MAKYAINGVWRQAPLGGKLLIDFLESALRSHEMDKAAYEELDGAIMEVGRIWANSSNRPKPTTEVLVAWDKLLDDWISSNPPLILRDSRRRGKDAECSDGQKVFFADNFPANWAFSSALYHSVPDIRNWDGDTLSKHVPLSILSNGDEYKRIPNLNKEGWKEAQS